MQTITSILVFIILSVNAYSQKGFYLHPVIENKSHTNNRYPSRPGELITDQGDKFQINPISFYNNFSQLEFGIHAGYRTKKMFYEIGWSTDHVLANTRVTTLCMVNDSTYVMQEIHSSIGSFLNKFPIRVGVKLTGKDSVASGKHIRWECFLYAGIDLLKATPLETYKQQTYDFMVMPNQSVRFENKAHTFTRGKSYCYTLGFMFKSFNRKGKNIFNIGLHYSVGSRTFLYSNRRFINYDGTEYGGGATWSKASGLYISFSKDIYPKNFIKKGKLPAFF